MKSLLQQSALAQSGRWSYSTSAIIATHTPWLIVSYETALLPRISYKKPSCPSGTKPLLMNVGMGAYIVGSRQLFIIVPLIECVRLLTATTSGHLYRQKMNRTHQVKNQMPGRLPGRVNREP